MDKIQTLGIVILAVGLLMFPAYGIYVLSGRIQELVSEVPIAIRVGIFLLFSGFVIVMISLIRERIVDWRKEKKTKR